ncbi:hypothetical protein CTA1_6802 [Colletotrichum tanaceti]|uniref:Uncharacterized protein n=1 Tax=Colletotrichum tanaceti TaxID=1306861 RepID=A0A4U6XBX6_9PEZI|nr:hypothetical protein CTA1_6802 [Colletotrichum tanaceti]
MLDPINNTHLKDVEPFRDSSVWKMSGPIVHDLPANEEPSRRLNVIGSTNVCVAESKEGIMEMLKRDVYVDRRLGSRKSPNAACESGYSHPVR